MNSFPAVLKGIFVLTTATKAAMGIPGLIRYRDQGIARMVFAATSLYSSKIRGIRLAKR